MVSRSSALISLKSPWGVPHLSHKEGDVIQGVGGGASGKGNFSTALETILSSRGLSFSLTTTIASAIALSSGSYVWLIGFDVKLVEGI